MPEERVPFGGVAHVSLSVPDGSETLVEIGNGTDYAVRAAVHDDGDGEVVLRTNTYAAAGGIRVSPRTYSVAGDDEIEVHTDETDMPMTNRTYRIEAVRNETVVDERVLNVTKPDFGRVSVLAGPPQLFDAGTLDAVRTAEDLGMLSNERVERDTTAVRLGETVVIRFDSPSFLGAVAAQPGETATERLGRVYFRHERDPSISFAIGGTCRYLDYESMADSGGVRALSDSRNGTVYLLVDHDRVEETIKRKGVSLSVEPSNPLTDSWLDGPSGARYSDPERRPVVDRLGPYSPPKRVDDIVSWPTGGHVEITGESGRDFVPVTVRSLTDPTYVERTVRQTHGESFLASVTLPNVDQGLFEVAVGNTTYTAKVGDPPNATWKLAPPDDAERVDRLGIEQLKLEDGGFVVAYRPGPNATEFERVGSAGADDIAMPIAPTTESQHLVVVAHRDGNGNGRFDGAETDPAYRVDGAPVREWVAVETANGSLSKDPPLGSFELSNVGAPADDVSTQTTVEPTPTPTPTATPSPTQTATVTPTSSATPSAAPTPTATDRPEPTTAAKTAPTDSSSSSTIGRGTAGTSADGPGFGAVGAVVSLFVLGASTARRG